MIKYAKVMDEQTGICVVAVGTDEEYYVSQGFTKQDVEQSDVDNAWYLTEKCPHKSEEEKEKEEKERVANLKCTKRVLVLMLEELGFDYYNDIEPLITANRQAKLEWDLCIELLRSNPLLDTIGTQLGISSEQIDKLFKYANGEITEEEFKGAK